MRVEIKNAELLTSFKKKMEKYYMGVVDHNLHLYADCEMHIFES